MKKISLVVLLSMSIYVNAQPTFVQDTSIVVKVAGKRLKCAWAGGFTCPQFSTIDLNGDGKKDLFVFDRDGNTVKTFINTGSSNKAEYTYAPQYESLFPSMQNMVLLTDFNCDGKEDIFTYSGSNGIMAYKNIGTVGNVSFALVSPLIRSKYDTAHINPIFLSTSSIPALSDIDNDGDLDILTFDANGTHVEYHKNMSKEKYGNCDSLVFEYQSECWGHFSPSMSANDAMLNDGSCHGRHGFFNKRETHNGSNAAFLAYDPYNTGVKDLIIGDINTGNLLYLDNTGTTLDAHMTSKIDSFPANGTHVKLSLFPAPFLLDVDNDGVKDLLVTPNNIGQAENNKSVWFYKNTGTSSSPSYVLQSKDFLQQEMIDVGRGAAPAFFDYDGDGLLDLLIGNYAYVTQTTFLSGITVFRNTGVATKPVFQLTTTDYANISTLNFDSLGPINSIVPTFGDIDGDGDIDMVIGESQGKLYCFKNTAGAGNPPNLVANTQPWFNIKVGKFSAPQLVDVDSDGLLDLLIGSQNGNIVYYRNTGTKTVPAFTLVTNTFGKVDVRQPGSITGYSNPSLFHCDKKNMLLCGSEGGYISLYSNVDASSFTLVTNEFEKILNGSHSLISTADINGDGKPDLAVGNNLGGVALYIQSGTCKDSATAIISPPESIVDIHIQPNPTSEIFNIQASSTIKKVQITDILGRMQYMPRISDETHILSVGVSDWPNGIYICSITMSNGRTKTAKISVFH